MMDKSVCVSYTAGMTYVALLLLWLFVPTLLAVGFSILWWLTDAIRGKQPPKKNVHYPSWFEGDDY
jgi:uncharacterized membrane protein